MILGELLDLEVQDHRGRRLGHVTDVRFTLETPDPAGSAASRSVGQAQLYGLIVSPHTRTSWLGYERTGVRAPALIGALFGWLHRGTYLVRWSDVESVDARRVRLHETFHRHDPALPSP